MRFIALSPVIITTLMFLYGTISIFTRSSPPIMTGCFIGAFIWSLVAIFFVSRDFGQGKVIIKDDYHGG